MSTSEADMLKYFSTLIEKETGIQYSEVNGHLLLNRLNDLAKFVGLENAAALWLDVRKNGLTPVAKAHALDLATNNETSFFRDVEIFEFFKTQFVPKTMNSSAGIRIWCAATSTGQEPYGLAMTMAELRLAGIHKNYQILATDISDRVLKQAASGTYSQLEVQRGLPATMLVKYFDQVNDAASNFPRYRIKSELSAHISFKLRNLLEPWPNGEVFDIVFCRNVLIYQNVENKKAVIARIAAVLAPGGYLVLGGAESLLGLSDSFEMEQYGRACVYRAKQSIRASA